MEKFTSLLEKVLLPIANKLSTNRFLKAISSGFSVLLPITMVGAIFTLLANLQIGPYQTFVTATHLKEIFAFAPTVTTDMLAIYAVFFIGKSLADELSLDKHSVIVGALSLFAFLLVIPLGVTGVATESQEVVTIAGAVPTTYLGSAGLFTAMILGLIVPCIYSLFIKYNIVIKLPEQVLPTIAKSFSALLPAFAIAFIFGLVRYGFSLTEFGHLNNFIYSIIKTPLTHLGASPLTFIVFILMCSLMWFFTSSWRNDRYAFYHGVIYCSRIRKFSCFIKWFYITKYDHKIMLEFVRFTRWCRRNRWALFAYVFLC